MCVNIEPDEGERREPNTAKLATLCGRLVEFIIYSWFASSIQGQCLWVATLKITFCIDTPFFWGPPTYVWTWSSVQQGNDALSHYDIARGLEISQTVPMPVQKPSNGIYLL